MRHAGQVVATTRSVQGAASGSLIARILRGGRRVGPVRLPASPPPTLLRPLAEYEALVGGGW